MEGPSILEQSFRVYVPSTFFKLRNPNRQGVLFVQALGKHSYTHPKPLKSSLLNRTPVKGIVSQPFETQEMTNVGKKDSWVCKT